MIATETPEETASDYFVGAVQMQEVNFALTNWAALAPAILCRCGDAMRPNRYDQPCQKCLDTYLAEIQADERQEINDLERLEIAIKFNAEQWDAADWEAWERSGQKLVRWENYD